MRTLLRRGFTMIELVLVIVILGIVSSIGAEIIANVYEGYILQRAQHRASIKTELAAIQIANRLAYAIPGTVVRRVGKTGGAQDINEAPLGDPNVLQWVGADADSFKAIAAAGAGGNTLLPGWSGFCDINPSNTASISTPGSNLGLVNTIKGNLGLSSAPEIYFPTEDGLRSYTATLTAPSTIGLGTMNLSPDGTRKIAEHYKLATSSYALEAAANGDLRLYYDFTPQRGVAIGGKSELLLRNVSTFQMRGDGQTIRFKICVDEDIGEATPITICKEKAVF